MRKVSFLLMLLIVLLGCGPPDYTIVSDPVWVSMEDTEKSGVSLVKTLEKETGKDVSFMRGELGTDRDYIEHILAQAKGKQVVLSPLFSAAFDPKMAETSGKSVILFSYTPYKGGDQYVSIRLSRLKAFEDAGTACARMLIEEPEVYGDKAAAVFFTGNPRRKEEMERFQAGFTSLVRADNLKSFEISDIDDNRNVRTFLDAVKASDLRLTVLCASRLNVVCIEELAKDKRYVIMEEGSGFTVFQENIRGFIEFDRLKLMTTALTLPFDTLSDTVVEADFVKK